MDLNERGWWCGSSGCMTFNSISSLICRRNHVCMGRRSVGRTTTISGPFLPSPVFPPTIMLWLAGQYDLGDSELVLCSCGLFSHSTSKFCSDDDGRRPAAIVTGAGSGIGRAVANQLARMGAGALVIACRTLAEARALKRHG